MIITIDGPAGSGKSTAARKLAARLELPYLDTGAMYRAIAYAVIASGIDMKDEAALLKIAQLTELQLDCGPTFTRVQVDGHDVSEAIRSMDVSAVTPYVARCQAIRDLLVKRQQQIGRELGSFVTEGRDQGSVVFPNADKRFVLEAGLEARALRRFQELTADAEDVTIEQVRENLQARDHVDSKQWEPLLNSGNAEVIDTTHMSIHNVIDHLVAAVSKTPTK